MSQRYSVDGGVVSDLAFASRFAPPEERMFDPTANTQDRSGRYEVIELRERSTAFSVYLG